MDYKEEQKGEIEALESIYYGDVTGKLAFLYHISFIIKYCFLTVIASEPHYKFSIPIKSEAYEPSSENGLSCELVFTYLPKYPDEPPLIEVINANNFKEDSESELTDYLQEQVLQLSIKT